MASPARPINFGLERPRVRGLLGLEGPGLGFGLQGPGLGLVGLASSSRLRRK